MWKIQAQDSDLPRRRVVLSSLALIILLDKKPGFLEEAKEAFCAVDSERNISFNIDKHDNWKGKFCGHSCLVPLLNSTTCVSGECLSVV
jgi:hypothetical protein